MRRLSLALVFLLACAATTTAQVITPNQAITVVDSGTACVTAPAACAIFALDNATSSVSISISGTWTGTLTFEGTNNDGIWTSVTVTPMAGGAKVTSTTTSGLFALVNGGVIKVRVRATAAITGSALVTAARGSGSFADAGTVSGLTLPNNTYIVGRNFANSANVNMFRIGTSDTIETSTQMDVAQVNATGFNGPLSGANASVSVATGSFLSIAAKGFFDATANALWRLSNAAGTIGVVFKVDALPTIGSGFGTSPAVIAGSTALAGAVNVGTGGAATTGVITFGGTAYPSAPFCTYSTQTTNAVTRGLPTTTQLTLNSTTAWTASDIVSWTCVSSR